MSDKSLQYKRRYAFRINYFVAWKTNQHSLTFTTPELVNDLTTILYEIANANQIQIKSLQINPCYVQMTISCLPHKSIVDALKALKGRSATLFLKQHPQVSSDTHLWSHTYLAVSLGNYDRNDLLSYLNHYD